MVALIVLAHTCGDVCLLTARLLAQRSEFAPEFCALCAEVCHTCLEECLKHASECQCRECADSLLKCEQACQRFASPDQPAPLPSRA